MVIWKKHESGPMSKHIWAPELHYLCLLYTSFFRKPGLPLLMVEFPDGQKVPYWNTFYQEVHGRHYLGPVSYTHLDVYKRQVTGTSGCLGR